MKKLLSAVLLSAVICASFAACSGNPPAQESSSPAESTAPASDTSESQQKSSSAPASAAQAPDSSTAQSSLPEAKLIDNTLGSPIAVSIEAQKNGTEDSFRTEDSELIEKLANALSDVTVTGNAQENDSDDIVSVFILYDSDAEASVFFQGGKLVIDNTYYEIIGYDTVSSIIQEIKEQGITESPSPAADPDELPLLFEKSSGEPVEVSFRYDGEPSSDYYTTDDKALLSELSEALSGIKLLAESADSTADNNIILLYTAEHSSGRIDLHNGKPYINKKCYEAEGVDKLTAVLKKIEEAYPEHLKKYNEWIHTMNKVDNSITELCTESYYTEGDTDVRRSLALQLLGELEAEGLIVKGSILDSGDMITYSYYDSEASDGFGGSGGISLKGFDPMFNGSTDSVKTTAAAQ